MQHLLFTSGQFWPRLYIRRLFNSFPPLRLGRTLVSSTYLLFPTWVPLALYYFHPAPLLPFHPLPVVSSVRSALPVFRCMVLSSSNVCVPTNFPGFGSAQLSHLVTPLSIF